MRQPEEFVPGLPMYYATAMQMGGVATGLLVTSYLGRPTKIEGNPDHPGSRGASDYFHLASILTMYDPDRAQAVTNNGRISSWVVGASRAGRRARNGRHQKWRRPAHPHRNGDFAHSDGADQSFAQGFARSEMASV